jgi:hypothetical protein
MKGRWDMSRVGLLGAAFSVAVAAWSVDAYAVTTKGSPFGNTQVRVRVGSDADGQWIAWQNLLSGECAWDWIGDTTGLNDDYLVASGMETDNLAIMHTVETVCGWPIGVPLYNGRSLDLFGYGGHDTMSSLTTLDTWIYGGADNDWIVSDKGNAYLYGSFGIDLIVAGGSGFGGKQRGEAGNDCLYIKAPLAPALMSCGDGIADYWAGPGTRPADCEVTDRLCCGYCTP